MSQNDERAVRLCKIQTDMDNIIDYAAKDSKVVDNRGLSYERK